jgi:hypothetical protein
MLIEVTGVAREFIVQEVGCVVVTLRRIWEKDLVGDHQRGLSR